VTCRHRFGRVLTRVFCLAGGLLSAVTLPAAAVKPVTAPRPQKSSAAPIQAAFAARALEFARRDVPRLADYARELSAVAAQAAQKVVAAQKAVQESRRSKNKAARTAAATLLKTVTKALRTAEKAAQLAKTQAQSAAARVVAFEKSPPVADPKRIHPVGLFKYDRPVLSCRFDPHGEYLFTGSFDNSLQRWDILTGSRTVLKGHRSWIRRFTFGPAGQMLISGDYTGRLIWWNPLAASPVPLRQIAAHHGWLRAVAVSPDGRYVVTGGNDTLVKVWSATDGSLIKTLPGHARHVYNVAFHPDGRSFVSGDLMGVLKQWEVGTWKNIRDFDAGVLTKYDPTFKADCGGIRGMDFAPDGKSFAVAGISNVTNAFANIGIPTVVLFDWKTGKRLKVMQPKKNFKGTCWAVRFHPSGRFLIGAGGGSGAALWFWKPGETKSFFDYKLPNTAYDLALHPDGLRFAVALYDKTVRIYDLGPKTVPMAKPKR